MSSLSSLARSASLIALLSAPDVSDTATNKDSVWPWLPIVRTVFNILVIFWLSLISPPARCDCHGLQQMGNIDLKL